jgi:glycosyltransferase involved in cell wall biosynthesis
MLRVLFVSAVAERGGQEVILRNILTGLDRSRFSPLVVCLKDGPLVQELEGTGTPVIVFKTGRLMNVPTTALTIVRICRLMREKGIDVVHTLNSMAHVYGGWSAALAGLPCCYHLQGVPRLSLSRDGIVSLLSYLAPAKRTVACSNYVATEFQTAWKSKRLMSVIHSGVTIAKENDLRSVREEFGIPTAPLVIMACRLQRSKGVHVFLDAAVAVARAVPAARFMVVGGPLFGLEMNYPAELHTQASRLGVADRIVFTGFRKDIFRFLAAADVVVHGATEPDSFPTVILEAAALGKPVVATDLGGPGEIIEDGATGILIRPNDREGMASAVIELLRDPDRAFKMGQAGANRVRERFGAEGMARQFEVMYQRMSQVSG